MNDVKRHYDTDFDRLARLKSMSWLSTAEMVLLVAELKVTEFRRREIMLDETARASNVHILLSGVARITCLNALRHRVTLCLVAPGPVPEFPGRSLSRSSFQCEAYNDCRFGTLSWDRLKEVTPDAAESAIEMFHQNDLLTWYRVLLRGSNFLNVSLHERIAIALLQLCSEFGIRESRGILLRIPFSHKDIANLVGASRPRVTEHLARFEREHFLIKQGRQFVVCADELGKSMHLETTEARTSTRLLPPDFESQRMRPSRMRA